MILDPEAARQADLVPPRGLLVLKAPKARLRSSGPDQNLELVSLVVPSQHNSQQKLSVVLIDREGAFRVADAAKAVKPAQYDRSS